MVPVKKTLLSFLAYIRICRTEFCKLGKELDSARGQDSEKYFNVLGQLKESYRLCSTVGSPLLVSLLSLHLIVLVVSHVPVHVSPTLGHCVLN